MEEKNLPISFVLRMIHNKTKDVVKKSFPKSDRAPQSHLQGGIMGFLYCNREQSVYQKDIEKEFHISGATATNTLHAMEKNGLIVRKSQDKDARLKRISMTAEATAEHEKVVNHMRMMDERMIEGLSPSEVAELIRLLNVISDNLEQLESEFETEVQDERDEKGERKC